MNLRSAAVGAAGVLGVCAGANAQFLGPTPYLSSADSPFVGIGLDYFHLEDFEDGSLNTPGLSAVGGTVASGSAFIDSVDADDGVIDGSGASGHSWFSGGLTSVLEFNFDGVALGAFPTHAGVVWTDVGATSGAIGFGNVTFQVFDEGGVLINTSGPFGVGDGTAFSATAEDRFFGYINAGGISRIVISMDNSVDWEVDHVQYGVIPAPGAAGLLGIAGLVASRRRR